MKTKTLIPMADFTRVVNRLRGVYQNDWFFADPEATIKEWHMALGEFSVKQLNQAVDYWIRYNKKEPLPSDLIAIIEMSGVDAKGRLSDPLKWPLWVLIDNSTGRVIDECFAPEIKGLNEMFNWFKKRHETLFGTTIRASTYEEVYEENIYNKHPMVLPEGFSSWRDWAISSERQRGEKLNEQR